MSGAAQEAINRLVQNIGQVIKGSNNAVLYTVATLLCRGHLLLEDVPGVGKTMLARSLAQSLQLDFKRIQCTPDLLPTDVTGVSVFNQQEQTFEFVPGPVFCNLLLADEINRSSPRTQSSLLECMAEGQVSVDGTTHPMADVFMVIATQNPVEFHGTFPLPEAQLDRFFMCISMGYPSMDDELAIMQAQLKQHPIEQLKAVLNLKSVQTLQQAVTQIRIEPAVAEYIAAVTRQTREHADVELGVSPRGTLALMKAAQALALMAGQDYVSPTQVKQAAQPVLAHRIVVKRHVQSGGKNGQAIIKDVLKQVAAPV